MVIRLQGFDRGVFGGNFHTHNVIHTPPGLDVVCYSNGRDYVRGMRHAVRQAKAGRVVMTVDSTALLNERHVGDDKDNAWMFPYPVEMGGEEDEMDFDEVVVYRNGRSEGGQEEEVERGEVDEETRMDVMLSGLTVKDLKRQLKNAGLSTNGNKEILVERMLQHKESSGSSGSSVVPQSINVGIVTYGNGVRTSLRYAQEAHRLAYSGDVSSSDSLDSGKKSLFQPISTFDDTSSISSIFG